MTKEFDERNMAKSRKVCEAMAEAASTGKRVLTERERQILDMWPRFEDDEYVWFGDAYIDGRGDANKVRDVRFDDKYVCLVGVDDFHTAFIIGEHVKRHVQSVLDADGMEIKVGDTVWFKGNPRPYAVVGVKDGRVRLHSKTHCSEESATTVWTDILTHTRPDSWELLEEDAAELDDMPCDFNAKDLIRRAKALAGVEVDE